MISELPFYNQILIILINIIGIFLGAIVYKQSPKEAVNRIFLGMIASMFFWVNFAYLARLTGQSNPPLSLVSLKIAWFATPLLFICLYFLTVYLLNQKNNYKTLSKIILISGIIVTFATGFTDLILKGTNYIDGNLTIIYGSAMIPFLAIIAFFMFSTLYLLIKSYLRFPEKEKLKIQYLLIGILIFYVANLVFNIFLPIVMEIVRFYWIGDYSAIFLLGFIAVAIVRRELFGIKVLLTTFLVGLIAVLLLVEAIMANELIEIIWKIILFLIFLYFGRLLIRSVTNEIKRRKEIERIDKAKSEFISIASHQLRTPLTAIKGYISMIIEGTYGKLSPKQKRPMENVYESNERLIRLVNDLLNLSRLDAGKIKFEPSSVSLEKLIAEIIANLKFNAKKKKLYLKMKKPKKKLPEIFADRAKLRQVILNIIDNAIKYTNLGGITVEIKKTGPYAQIIISDTGEGMNKDELKTLFKMFSRAGAGNKLHTEGAGVGLHVAKKFIEMHKGKVWAESKGKGKGSSFVIQIPTNLAQKDFQKFLKI